MRYKAFALLPAAALAAALLLGALPAGAATAAEAPELTAQCTAVLSSGQGAAPLLDRSRTTKLTLTGPAEITLSCEQPFSQLYLVWDRPPPAWECFLPGADSQPQGQYGFIHEYVALPGPQTEVTLSLGEGEQVLCDIYAFGEGAPPAFVQVWQPMLEQADMLLLPTHADDEHLFFGGTMPTYAGERGLKVQVAYMTNHWGEHYRPHELLNGLWTVGVTNYPLISEFPDLYASKESLAAAESTYGRETITEFQVEVLRRFKPQVVIAHDINGEYGHGAHILNASTLLDALELTADAAHYPESAAAWGVWDVPKTYLHLWPENEVLMDWNVPLARFGGATAYEVAVEGFACHVSQVEYFSVRQDGTWQDCRKFGLARSTVGPDTGLNDFLENIDLSPEPEPEPEPPSEPPPESVSPSLPPSSSSEAPPQPAEPNQTLVLWAAVGGGALIILIVLAVVLIKNRRRK